MNSTTMIQTEEELVAKMTEPSPAVTEAMARIKGDIMLLGVAGKMGPSLAELLLRAGAKQVIGVSRFSDAKQRHYLDSLGVKTIRCNLIDDQALQTLPDVGHIFLLAGHKFGSTGNEPLTWVMNTLLPAKIMQRFPQSRIVYVSSGNVYQFCEASSGGSRESGTLEPIGEYAQSRLGGERVIQYYSERNGTPVAILRLFYATELRYGVILDIAQRIKARKPIDLTMGYVNQIWQGDANAYLARSFPLCESPATILNLTGPEILSVREIALQLGELMGIAPLFQGQESQTALLGNAGELFKRLGFPAIKVSQILRWVAYWVAQENPTLNKPTKFESRTGQF
jgi:nucleoside-diphosphate-sugar epimerase